jgi:hypothetical protein
MKRYFYLNGQDKEGPLTLEELKQKDINLKTLIWHEGLDDWKEAENVDELKEIFELCPPPIIANNDTNTSNSKADIVNKDIKTHNISSPLGLKEASQGWIIAGLIFALLGGFLGVVIGFKYAIGNYNKETKRLGWVMVILGIISAAIWKSIK